MQEATSAERAGTIDVPEDVENWSAEQTLAFMVERFHPRLYVACSFQKEASVIMDMLLRIEPGARFFTLDTRSLSSRMRQFGREFSERPPCCRAC